MIAVVRLTSGALLGVNADQVVTIAPNATDTQCTVETIGGITLSVQGSLTSLAKSFNLSVIGTGQPSSQGSTPA